MQDETMHCPSCGSSDIQGCIEDCPDRYFAPTRKMKVHFSSGKDDWETPDDLFNKYDATYHFVLDAAADSRNHKTPEWLGPGGIEEDALTAAWPLSKGNIWLNPPYSRGLQKKFVEKAVLEADIFREITGYRDHHIVCLLPARTDTKLFHEVIVPNGEVEFLKGRIKFKGAKASAPFPSMIVVF